MHQSVTRRSVVEKPVIACIKPKGALWIWLILLSNFQVAPDVKPQYQIVQTDNYTISILKWIVACRKKQIICRDTRNPFHKGWRVYELMIGSSEIHALVIVIIMIQTRYKFGHIMTTQLPWHVQNHDPIGSFFSS